VMMKIVCGREMSRGKEGPGTGTYTICISFVL